MATAYDLAQGHVPPRIDPAYLRPQVPLPEGLLPSHVEDALNMTQAVIHRLNRNMQAESGQVLQDLIQHNNFSGLLSNGFDQSSPYRHNYHQKCPDLVNAAANRGKGGESYNGHGGWHVIACYNFLDNGDIRFVHAMFANLHGHAHKQPDWKYVGSTVNGETGSRRTETYVTNLLGTAKLRDGSAFLDPRVVDFSRWKQERHGERPPFSTWTVGEKKKKPNQR